MKQYLVPWFNGAARFYRGLRMYGLSTRELKLIYDIPKLGLFAHLNAIAVNALLFGRSGRRFSVECRNACYAQVPGDDWFGHLFLDRYPASPIAPEVVFTRAERIPSRARRMNLRLEDARRWFFEKFEIAPRLVQAADEFAFAHFSGVRVLGLHYRGTDKSSEAPRVGYEEVLARVEARIEREAFDCIFLATDEQEFASFLHQRAPLPILMQPNVARSSGRALHLGGSSDRLRSAEQAVIDFQLLARCQGLTKTASTLSGWAVVLNPLLRVEMLNRPNPKTCFFPDRAILQRLEEISPARLAS